MDNNAGLCGDLVSVGSVGTSYTNGIGGTALGTACPTVSPTIENHSDYQACIASPSTCTSLCVPLPRPVAVPSSWRMRVDRTQLSSHE